MRDAHGRLIIYYKMCLTFKLIIFISHIFGASISYCLELILLQLLLEIINQEHHPFNRLFYHITYAALSFAISLCRQASIQDYDHIRFLLIINLQKA